MKLYVLITMAENFLTLTEVNETIETYPVVVRVPSKGYEIPELNELPGGIEMLLEKPKCLQFAQVQMFPFPDELHKRQENGDDLAKTKNEYAGKEFLIPLCYPRTLKMFNKPGLCSRYSSMNQVEQDLPRYIRIDQETVYTPPDKRYATSSLDTGTRLEIVGLHKAENVKYLKCKSLKTSREYIFREDFAIKCSAAADPKEHTLLNLAVDSVLLPKLVQFQNVWAYDIVTENDDDARILLTASGEPVKILKLFIKRNVFVAWLKPEGNGVRPVALIPKKGWGNELVQVKLFDDKAEKEEYIKKQFGEGLNSSFVMSALYTMKPDDSSVNWLREPHIFERDEELMHYENVEQRLTEYENVIQKQDAELSDYEPVGLHGEEEEEESIDDYEVPVPQIPPVPRHIPLEEVPLPTQKAKKFDSHILKAVKVKAKDGFDKVHGQFLGHAPAKHKHKSSKEKKHKVTVPSCKVTVPKNEQESLQNENCQNIKTSENVGQEEDKADEGDHRLPLCAHVSEKNKDRPLPDLPLKTSMNVTDDDKLYVYDRVEDKEKSLLRQSAENKRAGEVKPMILPDLLDRKKLGRPNQSSEDFYSYSVEELEECLKMCSLDKFAVNCRSHQLDGEFFRIFDLNELKSEPFLLSNIDIIKVRKIIECGWRPKTQKESVSSSNNS